MENHLIYKLFLLALFLVEKFSISSASGTLTMKILKYSHLSDTLSDGNLCDALSGGRTSSCDPYISVCVGSMKSTCNLLKVNHRRMENVRSFDFRKSLSSAPTFVVKQRSVSFFIFVKVTVRDFDHESDSHDLIATFRLAFSPKIGTTSNYELMSEDNNDIGGLQIQVTGSCDRHYYGKRCNILCRPKSVNQYCTALGKLKCLRGWYGSDCSYQSCFAANTCQNGGHCREGAGGKFCRCLPGYKGRNCEFENPCNSSPCRNGATCSWVDDRQRYQCICPPNFNGSHCHHFIPCLSNPCLNGGDCERAASNERLWKCSCRAGYNQPQCSLPKLCRAKPCKNGGECTTIVKDGRATVECRCSSTFGGTFCEKRFAACRNLHCQNGGTCVKKTEFEMYCHCAVGFEGERCEIDKVRNINTTKIAALKKVFQDSVGDENLVDAGRQVLNTAVIVVLSISGVCLLALIISVVMVTKHRKKKGWNQGISHDKLMQESRTEEGCSINNGSVSMPRRDNHLEHSRHDVQSTANYDLNDRDENGEFAFL